MTQISKFLNFQQLLKCILRASSCLGEQLQYCGLDHLLLSPSIVLWDICTMHFSSTLRWSVDYKCCNH